MSRPRPYIVMNFAMSADGKISTSDRSRIRFSSKHDWDLLDQIRAESDAVLIGANTIRSEDPPFQIRSKKRRAWRVAAGKTTHPISIVLTKSLNLPLNGNYLTMTEADRIIATTRKAPSEKVSLMTNYAEIIQTGDDGVDLVDLCEILHSKGIRRLLVEGGGEVNMAFFQAGLIDEVYMTLCPVIIGGRDAPTPVDGIGFDSDRIVKLDLIESKQVENEIFQRYRVKPSTQS